MGFDKVFVTNTAVKSFSDLVPQNGADQIYLYTVDSTNLYFLILKSVNLFFIFL